LEPVIRQAYRAEQTGKVEIIDILIE